jgi:hypothetical protein
MNPLLLDFPNEMTSDRLIIRLPQYGDGQAVYEAIAASDELKKWLPFAKKEQTPEEVEINAREAHINFLKREDLRLHLFEKETAQFITDKRP